MTPDVITAYKALVAKAQEYNTLWSYYEGNHPVRYSTERLRELFREINVNFSENWCAVVINAVFDRLEIERFVVANNDVLTKRLNQLIKDTELDQDADDIALATLVCGEAFMLAWKDEGGPVDAYYHDPRMCHITYDPENPREKLWAAKWWTVRVEGKRDPYYRMNMYYPDRIEYYISTKAVPNMNSGRDFQEFQPPEANPYGQIPVFHWRKERRKVMSDLTDVIPLQDAINKLLADMMVTSEFAAIMERYVVTNANMGDTKNSPDQILVIPKGDSTEEPTKVGQFEPANLDTFLTAIDKLCYAIGIISRTPRHYFYNQNGDPSGEALITMEAPLNKKTSRFIRRQQNHWQRAAAFLLFLDGAGEVSPEDIKVIFKNPQTVMPKTEAEIRHINATVGLPLKTILRREGWTEEEILEMEKDKEQEQADSSVALARSILNAERVANRKAAEASGQTVRPMPGGNNGGQNPPGTA